MSIRTDKKKNMAYWDVIDDIAMDCVRAISEQSAEPVTLDYDNLLDISKEAVELITKRLAEDFGCEFPYVDGNY